MTKHIIAGTVLAASLGWAASAQAEAPFSWTGLYVGAHAGAAWGHSTVTDTNGGVDPGPFKGSATAALEGGTAGYNVQTGILVIGIEGDIGYMGELAHGIIPSSTPIYHQDTTVKGGVYGDLTGRVGIAVESRTLVYAKGGVAFFAGEGAQVTTKPGYSPTGTDTFRGWVAGGGIEHSLGGGWSVKAEYLHFDLGSQGALQTSITDPPIGFQYTNKIGLTADTATLGVNFRW